MSGIKTLHHDLLVPLAHSTRSHRLIVLPNGILTLLISDPTEDLASAAVCVAAGAHNDPDEVPGLAHFCEHLILLGSKGFPGCNEFHSLLSKAGGRRNAFTTGEQTCFFFEVPSDSVYQENKPLFNHLIAMLADAMVAPLFPEAMFEKEVYAIDDEHSANVNKTGRAMYHGVRLLANYRHPFSRFATGNFFTLNDIPKINKVNVKDQLKRFHSQNFIADKMTLVIRGSQSLNLLQKLALSFSNIKTLSEVDSKKSKLNIFGKSNSPYQHRPLDKDLEQFNVLSSWKYSSSIFTSEERHLAILMDSEKAPTVRLIFPFNSNIPQADNLQRVWCNILGDEGPGSLHDGLNTRGLSIGVSAFTQRLSKDESVLVLEIKLTNTGAQNIFKVIATVLGSYKDSILSNAKDLERYIFELESMDKLSYIHQDLHKSTMDEASQFSQNLQNDIAILGAKNILKGTQNWQSSSSKDKLWADVASQFVSFVERYLNQDNLRFVLMASEKINRSVSSSCGLLESSKDQYFTFTYRKVKFNPIEISEEYSTLRFNLPKPNIYIPTFAMDHDILNSILRQSAAKSSQASLSLTTKAKWLETEAKLISLSNTFELWTKLETSESFKSKTFISFDLVACSVDPSPLNTMHCEVFVELLKLKISQLLYHSELLDYTWEIHASIKGDARFGVTITGFTDGVKLMLNNIVEHFKDIVEGHSFTADDFRHARVAVRSRYSDLEQDSSLAHALTGLLVVMEENVWTMEDRFDALDDLDAETFKQFLVQFRSGSKFLRLFVHGDLHSTDDIIASINQISPHSNPQASFNHIEPYTVKLNPGKTFTISRKGPKSDPTNSICLFIQTGPRSDSYTKLVTRLCSYLMSLTLVPDLRFKKQLGYVVLGGTRILRTTVGIHITIMSSTFSSKYLQRQIDEYLLSWEKTISDLSTESFQSDVVDPFLKTLSNKLDESGGPESLTSEMKPSVGSSNCAFSGDCVKFHRKIRDDIFSEDYDISLYQSSVQRLKLLTKSDLLRFISEFISPRSPSRASLSVLIDSPLSPEESRKQILMLHLEVFLKMKGLRISHNKLQDIVETSNGTPVHLMKGLFKHFVGQGESMRLCTVVLKEAVKQVFEGLKSGGNQRSEEASFNGDHIPITDIASFQSKQGLIRKTNHI